MIRKIKKPGSGRGGLRWGEDVTRLVLEMLSHRTPPSCIGPNILSVAMTIFPNDNIVLELSGISFVRECRSVMAYLTKMLAAYQLAKVDIYFEHHSDGTSRRQITINNIIIRIATEGGFRNITLNSAILSEDETSEVLTATIVRTFREGQQFLVTWREVTMREYPERPDLLQSLPHPSELSLAKLARGGWIMTDTCSPMQKFRRLFKEAVIKIAKDEGMDDDDIHVFQAGKPKQIKFVILQSYNINQYL